MPAYFIHLDDPTYHGGEFPFGRRLGPFLTKQEAINQAVADMAGGAGEGYIGVYTEAESEKSRNGGPAAAAVPRDQLDTLTGKERGRLEKQRRDQETAFDSEYNAAWAVLEEGATPERKRALQYIRERTMQR